MKISPKEKNIIIRMFNQREFETILPILNQYEINNDLTLLNIKGVTESVNNNYDVAIESFKKGLELNPDEERKADIIFNLTDCYCRQNRIDLLREILEQNKNLFSFPSILSNPDHVARSYLIISWLKFESGDYQQVIDILTNILGNNQVHLSLKENAIYNRGICYFQIKNYEKSIDDLNALADSVQFSSKIATIKNLINIESILENGDFLTAEKNILNLEKDFKDHYIVKLADLSVDNLDTEMKTRIFNYLKNIPSNSPKYPDALIWAGQYAYITNNFDIAVNLLNNIEEKFPAHYALAQNILGCIKHRNGCYNDAMEHFDKISEYLPGSFSDTEIKIFEENADINESRIS